MNKPIATTLVIGLLIVLAVTGCSSAVNPSGPLNQQTISALAGATLSVIHTEQARNATATPTQQPPTATLYPTQTLAPSSTPIPTSTPLPTFTPVTATATPTLTPTPLTTYTGAVGGGSGSGSTTGGGGVSGGSTSLCNAAALVKDVTYPDGTLVDPGEYFTKVWRLRNNGTCTWNKNYTFDFVGGERMGAKKSVTLGTSVDPGETIDLAVDMVAPDKAGDHEGRWMLSTDKGTDFGVDSDAKGVIYVQIQVSKKDRGFAYDFAANYCAASWESGAGDLNCPGQEGDTDGFVVRVDNPVLESRHENEPALWTNPEMVKDGYIQGTFPAFQVKSGDHFLADVGCLAGYEKCNVIFTLKYQIGSDKAKKFDAWNETYDGKTTRIDIDLSNLDGEKVKFIFEVSANGSFRDDAAFWLAPHIERPSQ
jgi:hypothetical protein